MKLSYTIPIKSKVFEGPGGEGQKYTHYRHKKSQFESGSIAKVFSKGGTIHFYGGGRKYLNY